MHQFHSLARAHGIGGELSAQRIGIDYLQPIGQLHPPGGRFVILVDEKPVIEPTVAKLEREQGFGKSARYNQRFGKPWRG